MSEGLTASECPLVLVIDDERESRELIALHLQRDGYRAITAASGPDGLRLAAEHCPAGIILDIRMPGMDGYEVCARLRDFSDAAIVFVTVVRESDEVVRGLQLGADDYVIKPFEYAELSARLEACLRRREGVKPFFDGALFAGLSIDRERRTVTVRDRRVQFTPKEFEVLEFLMRNQDQVLSVDEILSSNWGPEYIGDPDLVKQFIYRLRHKLEIDPSDPKYIVTVRGSGYAFEQDTRPAQAETTSEFAAGAAWQIRAPVPKEDLSTFRSRAAQREDWHPPQDAEPYIDRTEDVSSRPGRASMLATRWALIGVLGLAVLSAGMVAQASTGALPGDGFYPFKTAIEHFQLFVASGPSSDVELHMAFSEARVSEMSALLQRDRPGDLLLAAGHLESDLASAGRLLDQLASDEPSEALRLVEVMGDKLARQLSILRELRADALGQAGVALDYAIEVSEHEQSRIQDTVRNTATSNLQDRLRDANGASATTPAQEVISNPPDQPTEVADPHLGDPGGGGD